jgi:hypothetical protein
MRVRLAKEVEKWVSILLIDVFQKGESIASPSKCNQCPSLFFYALNTSSILVISHFQVVAELALFFA